MAARVVVTGVGGRMGARLAALVSESESLTLSACTERPGADLVGSAVHGAQVYGDLAEALSEAGGDVVIDFTLPDATTAHAAACAEAGAALVIGTTGLSEAHKAEVQKAAEKVPVVLAPNMSVGVNLLFELVRQAASALGEGWDVEVVEAHHRMKRDAPSGTAVRIGEVLAEALGRSYADDAVHGRSGEPGARTDREIGFHAVRGGDVVGEHTVTFYGQGERLELVHRATDRDIFARGALRAAGWVAKREPGLYGMDAVLGLR